MKGAPAARLALAGLILAVLLAAVLGRPHVAGIRSPVDPVESVLVDLRLAALGAQDVESAPLVLVAIDDAALQTPDFSYPIDRRKVARLLEAIADAGARAVAVDIIFADAGEPGGNAALLAAFSRLPTTIAAAGEFTLAPGGPLPAPATLLWPDAFADAAEVGLVNIVTDGSGTPRHAPLLFATERGLIPHFALLAASHALDATPELEGDRVRLGEREVMLDSAFHLPLRPVGGRGAMPTLSAVDVMEGRADDALAGRLVVVGVTARALGDTFATPFDALTPGVEVLASVVGQLSGTHDLVRNDRVRWLDALASGAIAVAGTQAIAFLPVGLGAAVAFGLLGLWLLAVGALYGMGFWFSGALPLMVCVPVFVLVAVGRALLERSARQRAQAGERALALMQSPALSQRIASDPTFLRVPEAKVVTVLFVDLSGFTGTSETLGLTATEALLRAFHGLVVEHVEAEGGIVLNFVGDGALAVFGLLDGSERRAAAAAATAFALVDAVPSLGVAGVAIAARAGVHDGRVLASRLGHSRHQQVTISGDTVNVASRLLEIAKHEGAGVVMSGAAMEACEGRRLEPDREAFVAVRGRAEKVRVGLWSAASAHKEDA